MDQRLGPLEGLEVNPRFWQGRRVFLTGHTGFKGAWLSLWLQEMGAEVTGYALEPGRPSLFAEADVGRGMASVLGDIRELQPLVDAMRRARPEIVIHMAAQALVRQSYQAPVDTFATNVMGTLHLLEAVRSTGEVRAVVNVTTDKCYENREWVWGYREDEPLGGHDPYSSSKACAELVTASYRRSFLDAGKTGTAVATARAGNVIGGGDWAQDRLIPDILRGFEEGRVVAIRNPHAVRPWQHVLEPLRGYLTLAEALATRGASFAEAWNFGPHDQDARPVRWIVERLAARWGGAARWEQDPGPHPHEAAYLKLDISKARARLDWHPALRLEQALDLVVDWATLRRSGSDVRGITLDQIRAYQNTSNT